MEKGLIKIRRCTIVLDVKDYYRKGGDLLFKEEEIKEIYYTYNTQKIIFTM